MQIFIGQIHNPSSRDPDDFDYLVAETTEAKVITTIKLEYVQRIIVDTGLETEDGLDSLKALLNVNSKDDMIAWFDNYDYFSFNIHMVTLNA